MTKTQRRTIDKMVTKNTPQYNYIKLAEECNELALAIMHKISKPHKDTMVNLIEEVGDVEIRLRVIKKQVGIALVNHRIKAKMLKYKQWFISKRYPNI
jgi:NTP pyrophosphatase (non-canonical NTP hydrolase)